MLASGRFVMFNRADAGSINPATDLEIDAPVSQVHVRLPNNKRQSSRPFSFQLEVADYERFGDQGGPSKTFTCTGDAAHGFYHDLAKASASARHWQGAVSSGLGSSSPFFVSQRDKSGMMVSFG